MSAQSQSRSRKIGTDYDRKHVCQYPGCAKSFTRAEHLRRHKLNHEAKHKFACTQCPAVFSRDDLWRRHLRVSHSIIIQQQGISWPGIKGAGPVDVGSPRSTSQYPSVRRRDEAGPVSKTDEHVQQYATAVISTQSTVEFIDGSMLESELCLQSPSSDQISKLGPRNEIEIQTNRLSRPEGAVTLDDGRFTPQDYDFNWESCLDSRHVAFITDNDISWLFDDASFAQYGISNSPLYPPMQSESLTFENPNSSYADTVDLGHNTIQIPIEGTTPQAEPPSCGYRICNALTERHQKALIAAIRPELTDFDVADPVFSLANLRQGVHLYARYISKEFALFNHRIFAPAEEDLEDFKEFYGEEPPLELIWAIITLGWTLSETPNTHQVKVAVMIQGFLRKFVITHSAFTLTPPIWIIQLLFLVLAFARYQGPEQEYSFAIFHGVLISAVRRLDLSITSQYAAHPSSAGVSRQEWLKWIRAESLRRVVFQTFILDVQQAVLHGGNLSMSPFQLNLELPCCEKAWWANSVEEWGDALAEKSQGSQRFLPVLKQFWNSSARNQPPYSYPRDSKVVMYGIISIASEMRRREDNSFSLTPKENLFSLSSRVQKSFEGWVAWWGSNLINLGLETFSFWRNCCCMFKVAHTLYEVGAVDLQMLAGKEVIEGVRIRPQDYAKSQRKIRRWVKQDYALVGVSYAAKIIEDRLSTSYSPQLHCHHCQWILYLAGLICWAFGFTVTGSMKNDGLVQKGLVVSTDLAKEQCSEYLKVATKLQIAGLESVADQVNKTTGLLITLIDILREENGSGLIAEAADVLKRLVGIKGKLSGEL